MIQCTPEVQIIADSISPAGSRIVTFQLRYWRAIHAEVMTHRSFCLSGDTTLQFDLPAAKSRGKLRVYEMTLREFADKWHNGTSKHRASRLKFDCLNCDDKTAYSPMEIAKLMGMKSQMNLNRACRSGEVPNAYKTGRVWQATGADWKQWVASRGTRSFSIRERLKKMHLRQMDETTGEMRHTNVTDVLLRGEQKCYRLVAGDYSVVATENHRFLTNDGWLPLKDIVAGQHSVYTYKYGDGEYNPNKWKKVDGQWVCTWNNKVKAEVCNRQEGRDAITGEPLENVFDIHHIEPVHLRPDLAFDKNNVIAVNPETHRKLHKTQGWQVGTFLKPNLTLVESIEYEGVFDTYDLSVSGEYENFFADGVVVHNSRNAGSSRARPSAAIIEQVRNDPWGPRHWGLNRPGMQAKEETVDAGGAMLLWEKAARQAAYLAERMRYHELHKQIVNRILEPFTFIDVVLTSTMPGLENFFALRIHPDAQPEIQDLARAMRQVMDESVPQSLGYGEWHLPYILEEEREEYPTALLRKLSVARCARVSYKAFDGTVDEDKDLALYKKLVGAHPMHASPAEHQAMPTHPLTMLPVGGNFDGWQQHRKLLEAGVVE